MPDFDAIASSLYGDATSPPADGPTPTERVTQDDDREAVAARLYPEEQEQVGNPYSLDPDSAENRLYGGEDCVSLGPDLDLSGVMEDGFDENVLRSNLGYIAAESGASAEDMANLVSSASEHVRSGAAFAESDAQREQIIGEVLSPYSGDRSKLDDAADLVASYPDLHDWLARTGAGDNPKIVAQMVRLAQTPRGQARAQKFRNLRNRGSK